VDDFYNPGDLPGVKVIKQTMDVASMLEHVDRSNKEKVDNGTNVLSVEF